MGKRSFFYSWPRIYNIHAKRLVKISQYVAEKIGENVIVLEPACGSALLSDYLKKSCTYKGFDINEKFVSYAQEKDLDVKLGNVYNQESYSDSDVVVWCNSIHHVGPSKEREVINYSLNSAKQRLIIYDSFKDQYLRRLPKWIPGSQRLLEWLYNYVERDGNNQAKLQNTRTKKELKELMIQGFGVVPKEVKRDIKEIGEGLIVTYYLNGL